jgi:hypothetical protein
MVKKSQFIEHLVNMCVLKIGIFRDMQSITILMGYKHSRVWYHTLKLLQLSSVNFYTAIILPFIKDYFW